MQNLRDKLLKAGLVDKKSKKKADHEERKRRTKKRQSGSLKKDEDAERRAEYERRQAEQREQDRLRAERRKAESQAEAERLAAEHAVVEAAEREAQRKLQEISRARELVQASMFLPKTPGPVRFHFVSRSGAIRHLDLSTRLIHELDRGQLAIAQLPGRERWGLIQRDVAEQVKEVEPALIRFFAPDDGQQDLAPAPDPDPARDETPAREPRRVFSSQPDSPGGRRDR